jgi:general L-amino acid transport system permease protein
LSQTGHAIEIAAITLAVYLAINLALSAAMNWYNRRIALVTR